jgi:thiol:disulfide interchange protein DsbD
LGLVAFGPWPILEPFASNAGLYTKSYGRLSAVFINKAGRVTMKRFFIIFLIIGLTYGFTQNADDVISVRLFSSEDKLETGKNNSVSIEIKIKEPFHINSRQPAEDYLIPVTISFSGKEGLVFSGTEFPEPEIKLLGFSDIPLSIYEGTFVVKTLVKLPSSFEGSEVLISGTIGYQACDDYTCLAPAELEFNKSFKVADASVETTSGDVINQPEEGEFVQTVGEKGLFLTFLLIFLGGLALNLTPCVYPIIPITVGYFGGQAEGRKGGIVAHAILYVLGMAVTYSALGVIAAMTGSLFGTALQNPVVLIAIALVMIVLALSMFDLYLGTIFMGLTVGLVAAPCIGPFILGLLTYVGEKGDVFLGFLMFFVLALGLGIPFVFLAVFSGSINKLPRSGSWMVWVRTIFGFILVAMAIYFLKPLFPNSLVYHMAIALNLFIGGIYMAWVEPTRLDNKVFPLIRNIIGIIFFVAALVFTVSGIQSYVDDRLYDASLGSVSLARNEMIQWAAYSEENIRKAQEQSKPVFLDFHADWCIPCRELDKFTFTDEKVVNMSRKFVMLKVDLTKTDNQVYEKLRRKYKIKGVPILVLLKPDGNEVKDARVVGFIKAQGLLEKMDKVLK